MASNPATLGFSAQGTVTVSGFTGADTYFNGNFVLASVSSTSLTFSLTHANASASSNGAAVQTVSKGALWNCAPYVVPIYVDPGLTTQTANPFATDSFGNYGFAAPPGTYDISFNGAGINASEQTLTLPCVANSTCPLGSLTVSSLTVSGQITSTVATGTAPFSIASTTVVPNLNAQLHNGLTAPSSAIVGISDSQTLTNKTIDCTANTLAKNPCIVYSTASASTNSSISPTTMATAGASGNTYRVSWYFTNTALGTSCTGNSTVQFNLIWNDPSEGSVGTSSLQNLIAIGSGTANGVLGPIPTHANYNGFWNSVPFRAKANTAVQYSVTFVAGTGCSPAPSYQVYPILELLQ